MNEFKSLSSRLERVKVNEGIKDEKHKEKDIQSIDIDYILTHSLSSLIASNESKL